MDSGHSRGTGGTTMASRIDTPTKKVFIVGGGWMGVYLAQALEKASRAHKPFPLFDVTIIDKKKSFYNNVSGLQACVEPDLVSKVMLVQKTGTLKEGRVVHAEVETVIPRGAQGNDTPLIKLRARKEPVKADIVVLATGTEYSFPGRVPWWIGTGACQKMYDKIYATIKEAKSITIVGGGPVGCELAATIAEAFPSTDLRLVHGGHRLCSSVRGPVFLDGEKGEAPPTVPVDQQTAKNGYLKKKTTDRLMKHMRKLNVEVVLNERIVVDGSALEGGIVKKISNVMARAAEKALEEIKVEEAKEAESHKQDEDNMLSTSKAEWLESAAKEGELVGNDDAVKATKQKQEHKQDEDEQQQRQRVSNLEGGARAQFMNTEVTTVHSESGKSYSSDLFFFCTGPQVNNATFCNTFELDFRGRVLVDDFLMAIPKGGKRSSEMATEHSFSLDAGGAGSGVFAVGDCCGTRFNDSMQFGDGMAHFGNLAKNLAALCKKKKGKVKPFKRPHKKGVGQPLIAIQMGRHHGASELAGYTIGPWFGKALKSPEQMGAAMFTMMGVKGKPPMTDYQRLRKAQRGCCGKRGTKSAAVTYAPGGGGEDDW